MADFDVPNTSAKRLSYTFTTDLAPQPTCRSHPKTLRDGHQFSVRRPLYNDLPWIWSRLNSIWKRTSSCKWKKVMKQYENIKKEKQKENLGLRPRLLLLLWRTEDLEQDDSGGTGQSVIWKKHEWKNTKQEKYDGHATTQKQDSPRIWSSEKSDCLKRN